MSSQVDIVNRALTKLGEARIISIDDNVEAARVMKSMWDQIRDAELRARLWNFSIKRASIAALATTPDWGFDYQYQVPSDLLRLIQVNDYFVISMTNYRNQVETLFKLEQGKILTDLGAPLKIRYVAQITDTAGWDPCFVESVACRLAAEGCERLTQNPGKRELALKQYQMTIRDAIMANALEVPNEPLPDDTWVISRI